MHLTTALLITNTKQIDIEANANVFQTKISRFLKGINCLRNDEKKRIEKYLGVKINWETSPTITAKNNISYIQKKEIQPFLIEMYNQNKRKTIKWINKHAFLPEIYFVIILAKQDMIKNLLLNS